MNYYLADLIDYEIGLIRLIIEFLFGRIIDLNGNTEALNFRLVCKMFKQEIDRRAHLSIIVPISKRKKRRGYRLPSKISSVSIATMYDCYKVTERDWKDVFGDELSDLESSVRYLEVSAGLIEYIPNFNCLNSISWRVKTGGCYNLLDKIPHKELKVFRYTPPFHGSIAHLTRLSEIEIVIDESDKLIDKHLPSTILSMDIVMRKYWVDVIDLSKFSSLKYLRILTEFNEHLIGKLILPTSLHEFYSGARVLKSIN